MKITHDTRETHQPAPVVLPTRTMAKVSDRMRLIRQGDNRELAVLEAAVKKVCTPDWKIGPCNIRTEKVDIQTFAVSATCSLCRTIFLQSPRAVETKTIPIEKMCARTKAQQETGERLQARMVRTSVVLLPHRAVFKDEAQGATCVQSTD